MINKTTGSRMLYVRQNVQERAYEQSIDEGRAVHVQLEDVLVVGLHDWQQRNIQEQSGRNLHQFQGTYLRTLCCTYDGGVYEYGLGSYTSTSWEPGCETRSKVHLNIAVNITSTEQKRN